MAKIIVTCSNCKREIETTKYKSERNDKHFCSRNCFKEYGKSIAYCAQCQNTFFVYRSRLEYYKDVFCSKSCQVQWRKSQKMKRTCIHCGKLFHVSPSVVRRSGAKYCSNECHFKAMDTRISKDCPVCKNQFLAKPCNVKRGKDKYCSNECALKGEERTQIEITIALMLDDLNCKYVEQFKIDRYICDFFIPLTNTVIEADGEYWHSLEKVRRSDERKNRYLVELGYSLLRLSGDKIRDDPEWCKEQIIKFLQMAT